MHKRLVWLAPLALATLLTGCSVTVTMIGPLAPDSLIGYKLELENEEVGGPLDSHGASVVALAVDDDISYFFWDADTARDPNIRVDAKWGYKRSGSSGDVEIVFPHDGITDFIVECELTFTDRFGGAHRCEFERKETGTIAQKTTHFAWSEGTFELEKIS